MKNSQNATNGRNPVGCERMRVVEDYAGDNDPNHFPVQGLWESCRSPFPQHQCH
jgi:hypothetical protein